MKKALVGVIALAVALVSVGVASMASAAPNIQLIRGAFTPKKLPKNKRVPISLFTNVSATNPGNPNQLPNPTTLAKVDYDKDGKFYQKGFPTCDATQFTPATTTQQAKDTCDDSLIGGGGAEIAVPTGPSTPPVNVHAVLTVFNGPNKTVVLHSYNSLSGGQKLIGKISPADPGPPPNGAGAGYGVTLTVPVPPLAGGMALITQFDIKVKKTYFYRGKKRSLFSARCGPGRKLNIQARFTDNQGQVAVGTDFQRCKQKQP
jgi:hypothetical protein